MKINKQNKTEETIAGYQNREYKCPKKIWKDAQYQNSHRMIQFLLKIQAKDALNTSGIGKD